MAAPGTVLSRAVQPHAVSCTPAACCPYHEMGKKCPFSRKLRGRTLSHPVPSRPIPSYPILFIIILSRSNSSKGVSKVSYEVVLNCPISPCVILDWIICCKTFHPHSQRMHCYSNVLVGEEYCDLWAMFWKVLSAVGPQRSHFSPLFPTSFKERAWMAQEAGGALRSLTTRHPWLKSSTDDD